LFQDDKVLCYAGKSVNPLRWSGESPAAVFHVLTFPALDRHTQSLVYCRLSYN